MKKVLFCAALPRELKFILSGFPQWLMEKSRPGPIYSLKSAYGEFFLLQTGQGIQSAESSTRSLLRTLRPDMIVSLGFAGAVYEGLASGDLVWASRVFLLSGKTAERAADLAEFPLAASRALAGRLAGRISLHEGCIVTLKDFMKKTEIIRSLPAGLLSPVCDMETFVLAEIASERDIPFFAARAVTDTSEQEIPPELLDISNESGGTRLSVLLTRVLRKPLLSKDIIRLKRSSEEAARKLASLVRAIVEDTSREGI